MQVNGEELLEKYGLKANDAVLAEGKQKEMCVFRLVERVKAQSDTTMVLNSYNDLEKNYKPVYVAGGAAQNAARGAQVRYLWSTRYDIKANAAFSSQYVLPDNSTAYVGCVGKDALADQLRAANEKEGLYSAYQVVDDAPTGACAVVLTGHHRSLCTELGAAEKFNKSHLEKPEIKALIDGAKFFYLGGFFLTHGIESAMILAKHSHDNKKVSLLPCDSGEI